MRLVSLNLNGIRSAATKGWPAWVESMAVDCMGVQEVRAQASDVTGRFDRIAGLTGAFHHAERKGYSGVGLYSRVAPSAVLTGFGSAEFDPEGRYVEMRYDKPGRSLSIISCYFPSGSSGDERQNAKFRFLAQIRAHLLQLQSEREFILVGDVNIAHKEIDLKNWKGNLKHSGFLPEERAWMDQLLGADGLVDVFRRLNGLPDQYTWWSNRGQARANNVGWRIDYQLATAGVAALARQTQIYTATRFSDHAPLTIDYDLEL